MADDNRTEKGSARKRQKAREKGQVVRGKDLPSSLSVLTAILVLAAQAGIWAPQWREYFVRMLAVENAGNSNMFTQLVKMTVELILSWVGPALVAAWLASLAAVFAQGGFVMVPANLMRWDRLLPATNLKSLFSPAGLGRMARSLFPTIAMAWVVFGVFAQNWGQLVRTTEMPVGMALPWMLHLLYEISLKSTVVLLIWAGVDYVLQKRTYEKNLRMTKQEVKDEGKELEGSPEIKGRVRRLMRQAHRKRMMERVPKATVVVTNPTEYAVALEYRPEVMAAPVVVAKGRNLLAREIRRIARNHDVPIVENVPLAQALYRSVEIDQPIPPQLYAAVAEILAFLYRAQRKTPARPPVRF